MILLWFQTVIFNSSLDFEAVTNYSVNFFFMAEKVCLVLEFQNC